jgi:hypothetical protein
VYNMCVVITEGYLLFLRLLPCDLHPVFSGVYSLLTILSCIHLFILLMFYWWHSRQRMLGMKSEMQSVGTSRGMHTVNLLAEGEDGLPPPLQLSECWRSSLCVVVPLLYCRA